MESLQSSSDCLLKFLQPSGHVRWKKSHILRREALENLVLYWLLTRLVIPREKVWLARRMKKVDIAG